MFVKDRRGGLRNWAPGLFATFWVLLAAFSGAYLFRVVSDPVVAKTDPSPVSAISRGPAATPPTTSPPMSAEQVAALVQANEARDKELTELKTSLRDLSQQVTELNTRLKPIEKILGPVAAMPSSSAVTTSPPSPEPVKPAEPAKAEEKPASPAAQATKPGVQAKSTKKPSDQGKPAEKPSETAKSTEKPADQGKPAEKPSDQAKAPEKPSEPSKTAEKPSEQNFAASAPADAKSANPAPDQVAVNDATSTPSTNSTETANLSAPLPIPPGTTRFGIEIGSVEKQDGLKPLWLDLLSNHAALVAGLQARRIIAPNKKWRLIAGPFSSAAEATQACGLFKKANLACDATVFAGDAL
jgi:SPOR domain